MKKLIVFLLLCFSFQAFSQSLSSDIIQQINSAGNDMKIATDYQFAGIGLGITSAGLFIGSSFIKENEDRESPKKLLFYAGAITGISSVAFYIAHIIRMRRAGKKLKYIGTKNNIFDKVMLISDKNSLGLAYRIDP